jgi:hypothetical protein
MVLRRLEHIMVIEVLCSMIVPGERRSWQERNCPATAPTSRRRGDPRWRSHVARLQRAVCGRQCWLSALRVFVSLPASDPRASRLATDLVDRFHNNIAIPLVVG